MELTIAGLIAALGILFGLNYFGLFIAAYVFDRTARHILWYLTATGFFLTSGVAFVLSSVTPFTKLFLILDDLFVGFGFIALSWGLAGAFSIRLSKRLLAVVGLGGVAIVLETSAYSEISVIRLVPVSLWQGFMPALMAVLFVLWVKPTLRTRYLSLMMLTASISILLRPLIAARVHANEHLTYADQIELYGAVVAVPYLVALFGIAAGVFFHVMSDLVAGYRSASVTDSLTGLLNRRGFMERSRDLSVQPAALIMIDIDHFKSINDTHGHDAGDRVIVAVARLMLDAAPAPHLCGRLGGEEFAIVLQRSELEMAEAMAQAIRVRIEVELADLLPDSGTITASFGVARLEPDAMGAALLQADHALYRAKEAGRNAVRVARQDDPGHASRAGGRRGVDTYTGTTLSMM